MLKQFIFLLPEIYVSLLALCTQMLSVFYKRYNKQILLSSILVSILLIFMTFRLSQIHNSTMNIFEVNYVIGIVKALVLGIAVIVMIMYHDCCKIAPKICNGDYKIEFVTLILMSVVGIFISISARHLLLLFCGLELQALAGYALAAFNTSNPKSAEGAIKYFILGALMSCMTLLGISFVYGFSGGYLHFRDILNVVQSHQNDMGIIIGLILILAGILFKISAAPLHIWTPDVYEGSTITAVSYFATAQKIASLVILLNIITFVIGDYKQLSVHLIKYTAILSMIVGALGAIKQVSLKRLMGYSTVLNIGYVLIGVSLNNKAAYIASIMYMIIYSVGVLGFFVCLIALLGDKVDVATFEDIKAAARERKAISGCIAIIMFSMIGLPPLAGFFGKYYIFYQAITAQEFLLTFIGIITSAIAAFYYLKVIKALYFEEAINPIIRIPTNRGLFIITLLVTGFTVLFTYFINAFVSINELLIT